ncbi:MAG TPA: FHA domain-containing protein [Gemmatales bacterium]|nr:FHA domain-containing protein [Gemmatales bacterium]
MHVALTVVNGVHRNKVIPIHGSEFKIGRDPDCQLRPASEDVSREHCAIIVRPDHRVFLRDYGSRNGTILNHRMLVHGELQLENGDVIQLGPLTFRLTLSADQIIEAEVVELTGPTRTPQAESALEMDDIHSHDDIFATDGREPSTEETIQVSRPRLKTVDKPMKHAGPKIVEE